MIKQIYVSIYIYIYIYGPCHHHLQTYVLETEIDYWMSEFAHFQIDYSMNDCPDVQIDYLMADFEVYPINEQLNKHAGTN